MGGLYNSYKERRDMSIKTVSYRCRNCNKVFYQVSEPGDIVLCPECGCLNGLNGEEDREGEICLEYKQIVVHG